MAFTWGCNACIRFMERVLAWVSGQKTSLMMTVMATIVRPYGNPRACSPFIESNRILAKNPQNPPKPITKSTLLPNCAASRSSVLYSFGPANTAKACSTVWFGARLIGGYKNAVWKPNWFVIAFGSSARSAASGGARAIRRTSTCGAGELVGGIASIVKNRLCTAAQATLLLPLRYSVRGVPGKQPSVRLANHGSLTLCAFAPSYHSAAVKTELSRRPPGVAVATTSCCAGNWTGG